MLVNIFESDGASPVNHEPVDLRDALGDDDSDYQDALATLQRQGRWWGGGGAAPLFLLTRAGDRR